MTEVLICINCGNGVIFDEDVKKFCCPVCDESTFIQPGDAERLHPSVKSGELGISVSRLEPKQWLIIKRNSLVQQIEIHLSKPAHKIDWDADSNHPKFQKKLAKLGSMLADVEMQLTETCEGCGGEIIDPLLLHYGGFLVYVPDNGLCSQELESCEVKQ